MTVSLIISTYNWPRALYLCLDSVMQQTVMPSEIIIADDGSGIATRDVVRHFEAVSPVPVRHIWHEDDGFRLAEIRNKAIAASRGEYVIQIDGDLIRVNGYDEEFRGWGGEDSELATRLNNSGVRQRCMKFRGIVFHLYHGKCDRDRQSANEERYKQSLSEHRTRCRCGLDRHLSASERIVYTDAETAVPAGAGS